MSTEKYPRSDCDIGKRLLSYRKEKGKNGTDFANLIGISQGSLSDIERGKTKPSAKALIGLIQKTDIDIGWLLTGETAKGINESVEINPLLVEVNEWLNEGEKHKSAEFRTLFQQQMIRAFFDYEDWKRKRDQEKGGEPGNSIQKVA